MVYITGLGIVSGLGIGYIANKENYLKANGRFQSAQYLQTRHTFPVAEVPQSNDAIRTKFNISNPYVSRTTLLAMLALEETLSYLPQDYDKSRIAFVNSSTTGPMAEIERTYNEIVSQDFMPDQYKESYTGVDCTEVTYKLAKHFDLDVYMMNISTACSSSSNTIHVGKRLIESGLYDLVICGGADSLAKFTLNGFNSLKNIDMSLSKPFDANRNGLNLGEGAAYLLLESATSVEKRNAQHFGIVLGTANTNEAHHPSAPSPDGSGAHQTMKAAIDNANLEIEAIQYINAHGTATHGNDGAEIIAIQNLFGVHNTPYFNSTKTLTGHTLAASGVIETILTLISMESNTLIPNLRFETDIEGVLIRPLTQFVYNRPITYALNNSFGFGGSNVSIVLKKT